MPDHLHVLLAGKNDVADLWRCIVDFKQFTGYWLSKNRKEIHWQADFYDHLLHNDQDVDKQTRYILENPIRAGIVEDWKLYPFKGSTVYQLDTF